MKNVLVTALGLFFGGLIVWVGISKPQRQIGPKTAAVSPQPLPLRRKCVLGPRPKNRRGFI